MTKRVTLVKRNSGSIRQKTIQRLQVLALVLVIIFLVMKIYIQMFPYSIDSGNISPCIKCMLHDTDYSPSSPLETSEEIYDIDIQPAVHPLTQTDQKYEFTVITGASENHFCPMKSFLYNMKETLNGLNARIIVYDLGFSNSQRKTLKQLQKLGYLTELRTFQWSHYPSFWNITLSRGEYAWKPAMMAEVARDYPGKLVWLDSGTLVERKYFTKLTSLLKRYGGFISPRSSATMKVWTHPGVYEYYGDDHEKYDNVVNCNGASISFDTRKTKHLIDEWYKCALVKDCIAPPGSSRINHRQDQAILTYLAAKENLFCNYKTEKFWIHTHEDGNCKEYISKFESNHQHRSL